MGSEENITSTGLDCLHKLDNDTIDKNAHEYMVVRLNSGFKEISSFVARWALPNEGIPLYMLWKGKPQFDLIQIDLPENFVIREYYNIEKKHPNPREIHVDELKTEGYIGFVFTSPIPESLSQEVKVTLNFIKGSRAIHKQEFETRIVRPRIELYLPDKIEFPKEGETKIDIQLKYSGYGDIYGKIMASEELRNLVLDVRDLRDLFIVMSSSLTFKRFLEKTGISEEEFLGARIPDDQYDYRELLLSSTKLRDFTPKSFFEGMRRISEDNRMMEILQKAIEEPKDIATDFFKAIIDLVEKRPVDGVFLVDPVLESVELDVGQRRLFICVGYIDDFGNSYYEIKNIPVFLEEKKKILFKQNWEEQAGDWKWLQEKK